MRRISGGIGPLALVVLLVSGALVWFGLLPQPVFDLIFVGSLALSLLGSLPRFGASQRTSLLAAIGFAGIGICLILLLPGSVVVPFLAIALAYAQLTGVFARGLMPGRQPILEQLIRMMAITPGGDAAFWRFVRRQCQLWAGLGVLMTAAALAAMLFPDLRRSMGYVLWGAVVVQLALFILSHFYARWRYDRSETWQTTLKAMFQPTIWSKLEL